MGQPKKTERRHSRRREGNKKESKMNGVGWEEGEREPGRGPQRTSELHEETAGEENIEPLGQTSLLTKTSWPSMPRGPHKSADGCLS